MWSNIPAFPFNLVSEMIMGTHEEQPGLVITTQAQKVHNEKRAAKNNLGSRRKGGIWEEIWECSGGWETPGGSAGTEPGRGTTPKPFLLV